MEKIKNNGRDENGRFVKGRKSERKGKPCLQTKGDKHYAWKGGNRSTTKRLALEYGMDFKHCQICKEETDKPIIHHADGNFYHNERKNLSILCHYCHNAIHDNKNRKASQFKVGHGKINKKEVKK